MNEKQEIYIDMDDSGNLINNSKDIVFTYGGVFFLSLNEQEDFSRQYKALTNMIKFQYCKKISDNNLVKCNLCETTTKNIYSKKQCPELKSNMLDKKDRRRLINFIKKYNTSIAIIDNTKVNNSILSKKESRGRYKDYVIKREVKEIIKKLISQNKIDSLKPVKIIMNLDEQTTISNGYYDLKSSIIEELQYGIENFNYGITFPPILSDVEVEINYKNSYFYYPVQAADLIAGEVRHSYYNFIESKDFLKYKRRVNFLHTTIYLP